MDTKLMKAAFAAITSNTKDLLFLKDKDLVYRAASDAFARMAGKKAADEIIGRTDFEIFEDQNLAKRYVADDHKLIEECTDLKDYVEPITDDHGNARYGATSKFVLKDDNGDIIGILGITKDITREYIARQRYQQEFKYLFELPQDTYAVCYIDIDSWRIISQRRQNIDNGTIQECQTVEEMCRYAVESIVDSTSNASEFYRSFTAENLHSIYSKGRRTLTFKYERRITEDSTRWVRNEVNFLTDIDSGHLCVMLSAKDIDAVKLQEKRLAQAAKLDSMTMLLNHETTMEYIAQILSEDGDTQHALFMLDIDNFKALNDTLGHQAGDEFLIKLARELKNNFRESDVIGRIGGDEFFALMRNVTEREQIESRAKDILDIIRSVAAEFPSVGLGGSIGISLYPKNGRSLDDLYSCADAALYKAKRNGKNKYLFA